MPIGIVILAYQQKPTFLGPPRYNQETQSAEENGLHKFCDAYV